MTLRPPTRPIPQIPGLPVVGNLRDFRRRRLELLLRVTQECGDIGIFHVGPWPVLLLNNPEDIHTVLVEQAPAFEKSPLLRRYLQPILGNGLLSSENQFHRRQRKLIAPLFQHHQVATYANVMTTCAEALQHTWVTGTEIDITVEMWKLTLHIIGKTPFAADLLHEAHALRETLLTLARYTDRMANTLLHLPLAWPLPQHRQVRQAIARLDATIASMIECRRQHQPEQRDLLTVLLHAQDADDGSFMTPKQVRDEALTLFLAGHATMTTALSWTWYLLATHPHVYTQMQQEIDRALAGRTPTMEDLPRLPYTLQIFKEAPRLYPPAYAFLRQATQPVDLGDYTIPRGMRIAISPYVLHRRPDSFPNPGCFEPERFAAAAEAHLPRHVYLPFSTGPRICIGNHVALLEGQLLLATLAQRVAFDLVTPL